MKDWWQKLTIDWPCALGDWLWAVLVIRPAELMEKITRRRVLHFVGLIGLLLVFQYVVAMHLTFLFGLDLGLLIDVSAALLILSGREQVRLLLQISKDWLRRPTVRLPHWRGQVREILTRAARALLPQKNDEEDGPLGALA